MKLLSLLGVGLNFAPIRIGHVCAEETKKGKREKKNEVEKRKKTRTERREKKIPFL